MEHKVAPDGIKKKLRNVIGHFVNGEVLNEKRVDLAKLLPPDLALDYVVCTWNSDGHLYCMDE